MPTMLPLSFASTTRSGTITSTSASRIASRKDQSLCSSAGKDVTSRFQSCRRQYPTTPSRSTSSPRSLWPRPPVHWLAAHVSQKYHGLEELQPLVDAMKRPDPSERVSAKDALAQFHDIRAKGFSGYLSLRWRLCARDESLQRLVYNVAAGEHELHHLLTSVFRTNRGGA